MTRVLGTTLVVLSMADESFMKTLFHGVIAENMIFPYPSRARRRATPSRRSSTAIRRFFAANVDSKAIDEANAIPAEVLDGLKALGLFGLADPRRATAALGMSRTAYARVMQEVAGSTSIAMTLGGHQSIGLKGILLFGTEEQKRRYLPRLATRRAHGGVRAHRAGRRAATRRRSRRAPSAPPTGATSSTARRFWVTNGGFADVFTVFARTSTLEEGGQADASPRSSSSAAWA